eukprot:CAMPEP_0172666108 /NCGR_PEP_ID=MMETSP1074-20121228/7621_1 /TAXON_ID=2916 /ORGANISM="Ceratium fusus, Strain PA161109" /LENGTH=99 /DNA_ID=CAMNT_0013482467 /DNA_START=382 /DNA_END=681 /DNA_ORIENTATION=-
MYSESLSAIKDDCVWLRSGASACLAAAALATSETGAAAAALPADSDGTAATPGNVGTAGAAAAASPVAPGDALEEDAASDTDGSEFPGLMPTSVSFTFA